ncbi:hypothetical protein HFO60_04500 [Rhizobium leguminosarum]|uniref:hypothetical protein n=1 Tax=Rhizobium leguminosarum TaxID=384 RepID=UPI001C95462C|nr:hypothetical protein [Rhizobium leguminosarum]MBY5539311.1 hypothetical protein [Rhizobium leguminosarum]
MEFAKSFETEILRLHTQPSPHGQPQTACDRYLAICNCQLDDYFYIVRFGKKLRGLMVGSWSKYFAPPSLLEFIVDMCIKQGIAAAFGVPPAHPPSRGCIFDFNDSLENTRNGVLIGYICADCEAELSRNASIKMDEIRGLIGGRWLGSPSDPFSAYCELERLGFPAFKASGVHESLWQQLKNLLPLQFLGEITQSIAKYAVLGVALYLAIKFGLDELVKKL